MRQFECVADKKIYTESQLRQLFQFKVIHGYDKINDDMKSNGELEKMISELKQKMSE